MSDAAGESNQRERQVARGQSFQLPSNMLAEELGKVYVRDEGNQRRVEFTIWVQELSGGKAEGWQTGIALDASASMKDWYGRNLTGRVPDRELAEYERKGWVEERVDDRQRVKSFKKEAYEDAIQRGFLKFTDNIVEPFARDMISYLASELDASGRSTVIYWACGDGGAYEVLGDSDGDACKTLAIRGPKSVSFGQGTKLAPAIRYFVDRFVDSPKGMYVFITDGRLDDLDDVKRCTTELAKAIDAGKRNPVKCVLIGVGKHIDEDQMVELDDLDTGTDVDIWDHKIASEMRALSEIMVELVDEIVAPVSATIYDANGQAVAKFADGLPSSVSFTMPTSSDYFELVVGEKRIHQSVVVPET